jgi:hypothetical protein
LNIDKEGQIMSAVQILPGNVFFWAIGLTLVSFGCNRAAKTSIDSETSSWGYSNTDDSNTDDSNTGLDGDTDSGSDTSSVQPMTIQIVNHTGRVIYLDTIKTVRAIRSGDGGRELIDIEPRFCTRSCDEMELYGESVSRDWCCDECEDSASAWVVFPGDTVTYQWDGAEYDANFDLCTCGCHTAKPVAPGEYRLFVSAYQSVECGQAPCDIPATSGIIEGGHAFEKYDSYTQTGTIPNEFNELVIEMQRYSLCDHSAEPLCDMAPPECDPDYEILAWQDDCYVCVNRKTCLPWGVPNCETDDDCGPDEGCIPCGTSSCPTCNDCVKACLLYFE